MVTVRYSKHVEIAVLSLDEGEKQGKANPRGMAKPKVVPVDLRARDRVGSEAGGG